jgi:hypothetical protein
MVITLSSSPVTVLRASQTQRGASAKTGEGALRVLNEPAKAEGGLIKECTPLVEGHNDYLFQYYLAASPSVNLGGCLIEAPQMRKRESKNGCENCKMISALAAENHPRTSLQAPHGCAIIVRCDCSDLSMLETIHPLRTRVLTGQSHTTIESLFSGLVWSCLYG